MYTTDLAAAVQFLASSIPQLEAVGDLYSAVSLGSIAGMFAALGGDAEAGHAFTRESLAGARELGNPTTLAIALFGYALAHWQDEPESARAAVEESLALTEAGASDTVYSDALELLARLERAAGDIERALHTTERSLREAIGVSNRPSVLSSQWYFAEALGLLGRDPEVGAVLHGYTTRGADAPLMPAVRGREAQLHDQSIAAMRSALGGERFEQLAARGAAMDYDTAVEYTMQELERIRAAG